MQCQRLDGPRARVVSRSARGGCKHRVVASLATPPAPAAARPAQSSAQSFSSDKGSGRAVVLGLTDWALRHKLNFAGVRPDTRNGARGIYATTTLTPGDLVVSTPLSACFSVTPGEQCPFPDFLPQDVWASLPWYAQLACKLLHERALGRGSRWADYLPALPVLGSAGVDLPATWPAAHVAALQYPHLEAKVLDEQKEWARLYERLAPSLSRRRLSREDLHWALSCVRSRTFEAPHFPTSSTLKKAAGAAAAVAAAALTAAVTGGKAGLLALLPAAAAGVAVPMAWQAAEAKAAAEAGAGVMYAVVPLIDFFNHSSASQSECMFVPGRSEFRVAAGERVTGGQQVLISYGSQSNDALLQRYGFVEAAGNPHDRFVLCDVARLLARAEERAGGAVGEALQAAARPALASLDEVPVTPRGVADPATAQALAALASKLGRSPDALLAAACREALAEAPSSLQQDEEALAQLGAWEAAEAAAAEAAAKAVAETAKKAAEVKREVDAATRARDFGRAFGAEVAAAEAVASGTEAAPAAAAATEDAGEAGAQAEAEAEAAPEPEPEPVLPPAELQAFGGDVLRLRTVLAFRIAKKRVLAALAR
ncbi:hypothetical protein HYH03_008219 [Edaphochlamys debaryana]|uniref:SET domain-containing protein n=1 Tax=Edaphochlamys debaryana TaxID=47281 RepID=A0A836BYL0_9CHLO|nr:hypothetical protein HYH03_008219 [Edaphochlamys debaryana]|eukprot:KAG2493705.1 hypothetical protein HYH03_008219 [Edaphochlamys debaryana]